MGERLRREARLVGEATIQGTALQDQLVSGRCRQPRPRRARARGGLCARQPRPGARVAGRLRGHRAGQPRPKRIRASRAAGAAGLRRGDRGLGLSLPRRRRRAVRDAGRALGRGPCPNEEQPCIRVARSAVFPGSNCRQTRAGHPGLSGDAHVEPLSRDLRRLEAGPGGLLGRGRARDRLVQALGQGVRPLRRPVRPLVRGRRVQHGLELPRPARRARPGPAEGADLRQPRHQDHARLYLRRSCATRWRRWAACCRTWASKRATASSSTCRWCPRR